MMELGGNIPESLVEHMMLPPSPETTSDSFVDATVLEMNVSDVENQSLETNQAESEEDDEEEEEPLKAEGER